MKQFDPSDWVSSRVLLKPTPQVLSEVGSKHDDELIHFISILGTSLERMALSCHGVAQSTILLLFEGIAPCVDGLIHWIVE